MSVIIINHVIKFIGAWPSEWLWLERCLVVGRPGFDSLAELDQKTLKLGIHSFPAGHFIL